MPRFRPIVFLLFISSLAPPALSRYLRRHLADDVCIEVQFFTPVSSAPACSEDALEPDHPIPYHADPIFLNGIPLEEECYDEESGCRKVLCASNTTGGIATVSTLKPDWWGFELALCDPQNPSNVQLLPSIENDCVQRLTGTALLSSCNCGTSMSFIQYDLTPTNGYISYNLSHLLVNVEGEDLANNVAKTLGPAVTAGVSVSAVIACVSCLVFVLLARKRAKQNQRSSQLLNSPQNSKLTSVGQSMKTAKNEEMEMLPPIVTSLKSDNVTLTTNSGKKVNVVNTSRSQATASVATEKSKKKKKHHRSSKDKQQLAQRFQTFISSTPNSELGAFLKNRLSVRPSRTTLSSMKTFATSLTISNSLVAIENLNVESFKSGISKSDQKRFSRLKNTISTRLSTISANNTKTLSTESNTESLRGVSGNLSPELLRASELLYTRTRQLIKQICKKLNKETLDATEAQSDFYAGSEVPEISLEEYLYRLVKGLDKWFYDSPDKDNNPSVHKQSQAVGVRCLLYSLIYLARFRLKEDGFTLTVFNQHRLFAVMMLLAAKFSEDCLIANSYFASVSGLDVDDLNEVEEDFCRVVDFALWVSNAEMQKLYDEFKLGVLLPLSTTSSGIMSSVDGTKSLAF